MLVPLLWTAALVTPTPSPRCGILVVGLAGNNGVTLLAGQIANRKGVVWESSRDGPKQANCLGCITQVGKLAEQFDFTSFADLAVGGWDVVPTKLGEALYQSRVLDYDLVRQVREDMDTLPVMRGVWDASFYGDSQAAGATHIAPETTRLEQLARLRADIRRFKSEEALDDKCGGAGGGGHVTVVWSASVERPCEDYERAADLSAIAADDKPNVSPSSSTPPPPCSKAAALSTVARRTRCRPRRARGRRRRCRRLTRGGLRVHHAAVRPGHRLQGGADQGQDGHCRVSARAWTEAAHHCLVQPSGQQRHEEPAEPAHVEGQGEGEDGRLRRVGRSGRQRHRPQGGGTLYGADGRREAVGPIAAHDDEDACCIPAEHNPHRAPPTNPACALLTSERARPPLCDDLRLFRDTVEYTSEAFMGCEHTMLTYTRCMDSALCVPLMIDSAIFCDYLRSRGRARRRRPALAYLFKLNEGGATASTLASSTRAQRS